MDPFTEDDFTPDEFKNYEKASDFRLRNSGLMDEIMQKFGQEPDVTNARIDHLLVSLTKAGVLGKKQYTDIIADWETNLNAQLQSMRDKLDNAWRRARADAELARRENQAKASQPRLATPAKGIVLPGGGIHQVPDKKEN